MDIALTKTKRLLDMALQPVGAAYIFALEVAPIGAGGEQ
jgi:hypothetical protein